MTTNARDPQRRTGRSFLAATMVVSVAVVAGLGGGAALAQPQRERGERPRQPDAAEPALRGPEVRERNVPGAPGAFGTEEGAMMRRDPIPPPVFRDAVLSLRGLEAPKEVRLNEAQVARLGAIQREFESRRREYMDGHREELQELRRRGGAGARGGGEEPTPERRRAMERAREIERGGPQPEELYTKIWEVLTPAQREAVEAKLEEFRAERARAREEAMVRQRVPGAEGRPPGRGPDGEMMDAPRRRGPEEGRRPSPEQRERAERLLRAFNQLPAAEQERILARLEERAREVTAERGGGAGRDNPVPAEAPRRRQRRPAPGMDEVEVPRPE